MKNWILRRDADLWGHRAGCFYDGRTWGVGFVVHEWGVRFLLGRWDYCWWLRR